MGELFTSFDQAWNHFLGRVEPLEDFFEQFDEDEKSVLEGWVIEPSTPVKRAAAEIQSAISHLRWLVPVPDHFLHVWIGTTDPIGPAWERWPEVDAISTAYVRPNCFHTAVVIEVAGPIRRLVAGTPCDIPAFLPHMSIAFVRGHPGPDELRRALLPLRELQIGEQVVREVKRVRFPAARTTLSRPWAVQQVVPLR